jgi:hypothetical protein
MNNKIVELVQTIKYLGIFIDSKLTFRKKMIYISGNWTKLIHPLSNQQNRAEG